MVDDHLQYKEEIKRAVREDVRRSYRNVSVIFTAERNSCSDQQ